jgi:hypothetical protein
MLLSIFSYLFSVLNLPLQLKIISLFQKKKGINAGKIQNLKAFVIGGSFFFQTQSF